jgi:hypothetical protein
VPGGHGRLCVLPACGRLARVSPVRGWHVLEPPARPRRRSARRVPVSAVRRARCVRSGEHRAGELHVQLRLRLCRHGPRVRGVRGRQVQGGRLQQTLLSLHTRLVCPQGLLGVHPVSREHDDCLGGRQKQLDMRLQARLRSVGASDIVGVSALSAGMFSTDLGATTYDDCGPDKFLSPCSALGVRDCVRCPENSTFVSRAHSLAGCVAHTGFRRESTNTTVCVDLEVSMPYSSRCLPTSKTTLHLAWQLQSARRAYVWPP